MKILVALDSSEYSNVISDYLTGGQFSSSPDAEFKLLYVMEPLRLAKPWNLLPSALLDEKSTEEEARAKAFLKKIAQAIKKKFPQCTVSALVMEGFPREDIVRYAKNEDCGLIVVGAHGKSGLQRLLLGSVSQAVCLTAHCSVLIIKAKKE